jgi:pimeloyl-ACP methyl ester carboxylesterase
VRLLVEGSLDRAVVLFGAETDPEPELTWARGVTLLAAGGTGTGTGVDVDVDPDGPIGVVGWSTAGWEALAFAAGHPKRVDRLVLVSTPIPDDEKELGFALSDVTAKTLLLFGALDPGTGSRHGTWWQRRLPDARLEMNPHGAHDLLVPAWKRILSHVAPRCRREVIPPG